MVVTWFSYYLLNKYKITTRFVSQVPHALFPPNLSDILRRQEKIHQWYHHSTHVNCVKFSNQKQNED